MSSLCKTVKVIALIMLVLGVLSIIFGAVMFMNAGALDTADGGAAAAQTAGIIMIATGVFYLIAGISGALGANNPSRLGTFIVLCVVIMLVNVVGVVLVLTGGSGSPVYNIAYAVVALIAAVCAARAKKDAADRLL